MSAKWLGHGRDQSDFPFSVSEAIFPGGLAALVSHRHERPARRNALMNLRSSHNHFAVPGVIRVERHEFNEAHDQVAVPGEFRKSLHLIIIDSAHQYCIYF